MLQSTKLQQLLLQLLEPCSLLTPLLPLSVSLISLESQKQLLSCICKAAIDQDNGNMFNNNNDNKNNNNDLTFLNGKDTTISGDTTEIMPLLKSQGNDTFGSIINNNNIDNNDSLADKTISNLPTNINSKMENEFQNNQNMIKSTQLRIEELQQQLDKMDENYDSDYINANVNPIDNLNILSLMVIRDWNQRTDINNKWKVYLFGNYRLYFYEINEKYAIILCTTVKYPSKLAISRLESVCTLLSTKL